MSRTWDSSSLAFDQEDFWDELVVVAIGGMLWFTDCLLWVFGGAR